MSASPPIIVLFRADLRVADHPALHAAAETGAPVVPVFVLDEDEASRPLGGASRWWLHHSLAALHADLSRRGSRLILRRGRTVDVLQALLAETGAQRIHLSRSHEPGGRALERAVRAGGLSLRDFPGNCLHEPGSVLTQAGTPFKVFTPFYRSCLTMSVPRPLPAPERLVAPTDWPASEDLDRLRLLPSPVDWAGGLRQCWMPGERGAHQRLDDFLDAAVTAYGAQRDVPGEEGTSRLSPHLRFGEISAREIWHAANTHPAADSKGAASFLRELVWREFSAHLLFACPEMTSRPLRPEFEEFPWVHDNEALQAWQCGETGYPIVDAGMRQLWQTGWMHNRVRMIAASFLVKDLRIDWRRGEEWFWDTLVDADLANNAMGWQWVAGCGSDASPYFRVFNPVTQARKFDPDGTYIRRWVPELAALPNTHLAAPWSMPSLERASSGVVLGRDYPHPMVDHDVARHAALDALKQIKVRELTA